MEWHIFPPLTTTAGAGGIVVSIAAFQAVDPGSIPGQRILLFYLFHDFSFLPKSNHDIGGLQYQCESLQGIHFLAGYPQEDMKRWSNSPPPCLFPKVDLWILIYAKSEVLWTMKLNRSIIVCEHVSTIATVTSKKVRQIFGLSFASHYNNVTKILL